MCNQNTPRKKFRKESNISTKKYHHRPTLGLRSERVNWTPYVETKKAHDEPKMEYDTRRRPDIVPAIAKQYRMRNPFADRTTCVSRTLQPCARRAKGGARSTGYREIYEATLRARIDLATFPRVAAATA